MASHFWYLKICPHLSREFLGCHPGQELLRVLATRLTFLLAVHASASTQWFSVERVQALRSAEGRPPVCHQPKVLLLLSSNSWTQGLRAGGHSRSSSSVLGSGLDQSDGSPVPSSSPQVRGGGSSPLISFPVLCSKVACTVSITLGRGTGLTSWLAPLGVILPGGLWPDSSHSWDHLAVDAQAPVAP